jgi:UDPglucose 6-dehydrogenase
MGATVRAYDPEGMHEAKKHLPDLTYCTDAYDAMKDADAVVILTEWNQFRSLDTSRMKSVLKAPVMVDLRNVYSPADMKSAGFSYTCVGRPTP